MPEPPRLSEVEGITRSNSLDLTTVTLAPGSRPLGIVADELALALNPHVAPGEPPLVVTVSGEWGSTPVTVPDGSRTARELLRQLSVEPATTARVAWSAFGGGEKSQALIMSVLDRAPIEEAEAEPVFASEFPTDRLGMLRYMIAELEREAARATTEEDRILADSSLRAAQHDLALEVLRSRP